ncbi:MAG TPA: Ig-like domain-containing protein [Candidatus Saccharimonadales bacterium]|nr:Ig-like domain-containing protein [Candidatus Saccharimonadales bacterium]
MARKNSTETKTKTSRSHRVVRHVQEHPRWGWIAFGVVFAAIGGYILLHASFAATPPAPTVYLTPSTKNMPINTTFTVQVRENSGTATVNAVQANFSYPATLVDFVSIDTTGTAFTTIAPSSGGNGQVSIAQGLIGSTSGDQLIATVTFKTKTTGGTAAMAFTSGTALLSNTTNTDILGSLAATGGGSYLIDTVAPTVSVTSPANGSAVSAGSTASVTATASDNDSVSSVDFYIDGTKVSTDTTSPYNYSWNTTNVSLGTHTIQAKATDPSGNLGSSSTISVNVADQTPPTITLTAPTNGSALKGSATISATASDNAGGAGVAKVEFYVDGALKGTDTTSPYSISWDTTTATNASHTVNAIAYDAATPANTATSGNSTVTVDNAAPSTPSNLQMTSNTFTSITLSWTASSDNVGVTGYRVSRNGTVLTTTSGSSFSYIDSGLTASTTYSYSVVALDAVGNASPAATLSASTVTAKVGDINGDNNVDITDLSILLSNWSMTTPSADLNHDGVVNIIDLSVLLSHWGT